MAARAVPSEASARAATAGMPHQDDAVVGPSDRSFGLTFGALFAIAGLLPLWRGGMPRWWALMVSALFWTLAIAWPRALAPANRIWFHIGLLMHRVVNPVVMALVYYIAITPFGLLTRMFRSGLARQLRLDPKASTYWITRDATTSRMDQQF
jgi:hypothetical protein